MRLWVASEKMVTRAKELDVGKEMIAVTDLPLAGQVCVGEKEYTEGIPHHVALEMSVRHLATEQKFRLALGLTASADC